MVEVVVPGSRAVQMNGRSASAQHEEWRLGEGEPLPPEDILTREQLVRELECLYRSRAAPLADRLGKHGARPDEKMDFIHEAFARMLGRSTGSHLRTGCKEAYVARISRNLLSEKGRAQIVSKRWADDASVRAQQHHDPVVHLESRDRLRRLEAAVMKLRPKTRKIFLARRLDGLGYEEIGAMMGMSVRAVEWHMSRAIAKLSRLMDRP